MGEAHIHVNLTNNPPSAHVCEETFHFKHLIYKAMPASMKEKAVSAPTFNLAVESKRKMTTWLMLL